MCSRQLAMVPTRLPSSGQHSEDKSAAMLPFGLTKHQKYNNGCTDRLVPPAGPTQTNHRAARLAPHLIHVPVTPGPFGDGGTRRSLSQPDHGARRPRPRRACVKAQPIEQYPDRPRPQRGPSGPPCLSCERSPLCEGRSSFHPLSTQARRTPRDPHLGPGWARD